MYIFDTLDMKKSIIHKSVSPSDLSKFLKSSKNLVILDVRTKGEFEGHGEPDFGTLKNSVNIPISDLEKGGYKGLDKNKMILVPICFLGINFSIYSVFLNKLSSWWNFVSH